MSNPSGGAAAAAAGDGEWTVVHHRRNGRPKPPKLRPSPSIPKSPSLWTPDDPIVDADLQSKLLRTMILTTERLERSRFYQRFLQRLRSPAIQKGLALIAPSPSPMQMVVYGVGSVACYDSPRLQVALALLIRRELGDAVVSLEVFDPVLSATECVVLTVLGFKVVPFDELGRREVETPTLFYMPHCEAYLYDGLLEVNWTPNRLNRMTILGNSFSVYWRHADESRGFGGSVVATSRYLHGVRKFVRQAEIEEKLDGGAFADGRSEVAEPGIFQAFHDTSWHFFEVGEDAEMKLEEDPLQVDGNGEIGTCTDFEKRRKMWKEGKISEWDGVGKKITEEN